ncbi:MAG: ATP-binding protein [Candidatus Aminicenantes bacterium]|nr:ATP-binding protein [Candidatus Aminicenantes bacterium]
MSIIKTYIERPFVLDRISPFIGKPVIKVLVGQRRVGKSFLLYQIMDALRKKGVSNARIVYINKELHEFDDIRTDRDLLAYIETRAPKGKDPIRVFIDEIQEIDRFEKALRSLVALGGYDLYCTGSNARMLSGELATGLGGRAVEIRVHALTFPEFLRFHRLAPSPQSLETYIRLGGLPFLIHLPPEERTVYEYLRSVYGAILFKDVIRRHNIRNPAFLERLVLFLADNVGSLVSAKKISDFLKAQSSKISPNIVLDYLGYLTESYAVHRARRYDIAGNKIFEIGEKYYFEDLGLRHALVGFRQVDIHKTVENLVFVHLTAAGFEVMVGKTNGGEIDFVCRRDGERLYVQTVYLLADKKTREREFGRLLEIKDNYPKYVVSMDPMAGGNVQGVRHIALLDFLQKTW